MARIVDQYMEIIKKRNPGEPEFLQTAEEVLGSIEPVLKKHPEYVKSGLVERLIEPERMITFRVPWVDDKGKTQVNRGYRCQFNSALGPYKGGIRFAPNVYPGIIHCLAFEQIFKNALTGLPIGGAKGGADFDPNGKSDAEVMRFCQSFMTELYRHVGANIDSPAGDLGVGGREVGYMFGQYKRLTAICDGSGVTGKPVSTQGLLGRTEATGHGIVFFLKNMVEANKDTLKGKTVVISGFGNVAWGTAQQLEKEGAKLIAFSGPDGYILDEAGITGKKVEYFLDLRNSGKNICEPYAKKFKTAKFFKGQKPWGVKADIYIPCAMQNDVLAESAKLIIKNKAKYYCEGANMPTSNEAIEMLQKAGIPVGPAKAANAGGVACSAIEMSQNARKMPVSREEVDEMLYDIMKHIYEVSSKAAKEYKMEGNLVAGANIAGFVAVAEAMMAQGIV